MTDKLKQAAEHLLKVLYNIRPDEMLQSEIDTHLSSYGEHYPNRLERYRNDKRAYLGAIAELEAALKHADETNTSQERVQNPAKNEHVMQQALEALDWMPTDDGSMELWRRQRPAFEALRAALAAPQGEPPKFPTMLRKMWSGGEVQQWINENWEPK